jgi:hypothetical protein
MHWQRVSKLLWLCYVPSLTRDTPTIGQRIAASEERVSFAAPGFSIAAP